MEKHLVVLITAPSVEVGRQIANRLLDKKLVASVNIVPQINSLYVWQGQVADNTEVLLVAKTRAEVFADKLVPAVQAVHPYDVPQIIALPIVMGSQSYLDWIEAEVTG